MAIIKIVEVAVPRNPAGMPTVQLDAAHFPFKMLSHEDLLRRFVSGEDFNPVHMRLGITGACNMRCNFCNFHSEKESQFYDLFSYKDALTGKDCIDLMQSFRGSGGRAVTLCGSGENTVHKEFVEVCDAAATMGLRLGLITNGSRLHDESIAKCIARTHTWVRIGMNAGTEESFCRVTHSPKGTFERMMASIRAIRQTALDPEFRIGLNYVITSENFTEIALAAKKARESGAHYVRFEPEFYSALGHQTIESNMAFITAQLESAAAEETEEFEVSVPKLDRGPMDQTEAIEGDFTSCHYSRFVTAVGADGNLYPCPQVHLNSRYRIGDVVELGYQEVLRGGPRHEWEEANPLRTDLCKSCFYRPQNEMLQKLKDGRLDLHTVLECFRIEVPKTLHADFV